MSRPHLLFVVHDAGGACALTPVLSLIPKNDFRVSVYARGPALGIIGKLNDIAIKHITSSLDIRGSDVVITGTGLGDIPEKTALELARQYSVPSIAVVDYWSNYTERFSSSGTNDWKYLPDMVCVVDTRMADELKRTMDTRGIVNQSNLIITGNPSFDALKSITPDRDSYIVFVSQPYTELPDGVQPDYSFSEVEIFRQYMKTLDQLYDQTPIFIALHPREQHVEKFNSIINQYPRVSLSHQSTDELVHRARLVMGIDSMVLFTSAIRGANVISYQPGIDSSKDRLPSNRMGLSMYAYTPEGLVKALGKALASVKMVAVDPRAIDHYIDGGAANRVYFVIRSAVRTF